MKQYLTEYSTYFEDSMEEYDVNYVFNQFLYSKGNGTLNWGELINPSSYQAALDEFMKYGKFERFPSNTVYRWIGIIIRNTFILASCTEIAGHSQGYPFDDLELFFEKYYGDRFVELDDDNVTIISNVDEFNEKCRRIGLEINESNGIHRDGQYDLFMNQEEVDDYDRQKEEIDKYKLGLDEEGLESLVRKVNEYNKTNGYGSYHHDSFTVTDNGKLLRHIESSWLLDEIGYFDWAKLPDGSDAVSDYGLQPLFEIINEYDDDMTPEETLVLVNRALDVSHPRGNLSSIFIKGGRESLTKISSTGYYNEHKSHKVITLTESQLIKLRKYLRRNYLYL